MANIKELVNLGARIYNNKMIVETNEAGEKINVDERDIKEICQKTFGDGSVTPSPEKLHTFNEILVKTADIIAEPKVDAILNLFTQYQTAQIGDTVIYELPKDNKPKILWTALGSGVDLVRLTPDKTRKYAQPQALTFGAYYEPISFVRDAVKAFNDAVNKIAEAKVDLYFQKVMELIDAAVTAGDIPANNCKSGSNLTLADFKKVENVMVRLGGRPVFVGDSALINHFADQISTAQKDLLTDDLRAMLREDLTMQKISKSVAVNFVNPYIDEDNSKVKFDVKAGYVFAGSVSGQKPFAITNFGGTRQYSEMDAETERVKLKLVVEADITLLNGRFMGRIKDDSVSI